MNRRRRARLRKRQALETGECREAAGPPPASCAGHEPVAPAAAHARRGAGAPRVRAGSRPCDERRGPLPGGAAAKRCGDAPAPRGGRVPGAARRRGAAAARGPRLSRRRVLRAGVGGEPGPGSPTRRSGPPARAHAQGDSRRRDRRGAGRATGAARARPARRLAARCVRAIRPGGRTGPRRGAPPPAASRPRTRAGARPASATPEGVRPARPAGLRPWHVPGSPGGLVARRGRSDCGGCGSGSPRIAVGYR